MANGILIVDKPQDWTSQDVVSKLRGVFHERRIGHGGTLDPMATGVLPVFIGRATRGVEFFEHADKVYCTQLKLGVVTDTQDSSGNVLEEKSVQVGAEDMAKALAQFRGNISQIPPMYSAIKIGGKKLYELARAGKEVERKPREITIFSLEAKALSDTEWELLVHCSKGTYVRTLCHDIGQALGCGACMTALRRVKAGEYDLAQSTSLDKIVACEDPEALLLPTDSLFASYPTLTLSPAQEKCCRNGASFTFSGEGSYRVYGQDGTFLALSEVREGKLCTIKSFF
ncbi:MAG: tRNA pseudouridine(55) synthase TruB [Oscillospiraceae bacterium]|nr:tRNA pseudouridine(55) synthase TruB [Oscillospiraceae bacterium]